MVQKKGHEIMESSSNALHFLVVRLYGELIRVARYGSPAKKGLGAKTCCCC